MPKFRGNPYQNFEEIFDRISRKFFIGIQGYPKRDFKEILNRILKKTLTEFEGNP